MTTPYKVSAWLHINDNCVSLSTEEAKNRCSFPCELWADVEGTNCGDGDFAMTDIWINSEHSEQSTKLNHHLAQQACTILTNNSRFMEWAQEQIGYVDPRYERLGPHETVGSRRVA